MQQSDFETVRDRQVNALLETLKEKMAPPIMRCGIGDHDAELIGVRVRCEADSKGRSHPVVELRLRSIPSDGYFAPDEMAVTQAMATAQDAKRVKTLLMLMAGSDATAAEADHGPGKAIHTAFRIRIAEAAGGGRRIRILKQLPGVR